MGAEKKKILVFVDWYLPGYKAGGPIRSVANMCSRLKDDYHFRIVTSNTDLHETVPYSNVKSNSWTKGPDGTEVLYLSSEKQTQQEIKRIITEERADVIYINSVFSKPFAILPLLIRKKYFASRKVVLAPRGMLGQGALNIKPLKKKVFLTYAKLTGLYRNIRWHASSESEVREIKRVFGESANALVGMNLSSPRTIHFTPREKRTGDLRIVFLSRISYKKNLEGALKVIAAMPDKLTVTFDIFGPVEEPEYWQRCSALMTTMPAHVRVSYKGALANEQVEETLRSYHLSILLTFNENFGHSIVESLAAGCPVLLSDQTPWKNLAARKAGWEYPNMETENILQALITAAEMNQETFDQWSKGAVVMADQIINNPESIQQHHQLFA
ncbi:MAG: glycosyltransferase [Bacteroidia bacterium]